MSVRELTDRSHDDATFVDVAWRGHSLDAIRDALPDTFDFGEDITDSQRCWIGYRPTTDEFLAGFDLWLDREGDDDDDDEGGMAGGLATFRLANESTGLVAHAIRSERFEQSIYEGDTLDVIRGRYPDYVEIDID